MREVIRLYNIALSFGRRTIIEGAEGIVEGVSTKTILCLGNRANVRNEEEPRA